MTTNQTLLPPPTPSPAETIDAAPPRPAVTVTRGQRVREIALFWCFSALAASSWQLAKLAVKYYRLNEFTWAGRDTVWMSPLANLLLIGLPCLVLVLLAVARPRLVPRGLAFAVPFFCAGIAMTRLVPGLQNYSMLILAIGLAVQGARMVSPPGNRWLPLVRWGTGAMAVVLLLATVVIRGSRNTAEWRWERSAAAAPAGVPNVLILLLDTVRAQSLSLYGYERPTTPSIDSLAREGVVFDHAFSNGSWTLPAHCTFFTGVYPADHSCRWERRLDEKPRTVAEVFRDRGYRTAGFTANAYYTTWESGVARGFNRWDDFNVSFKQLLCASVLAQVDVVRRLLWKTGDERWRGWKNVRIIGDPKPEYDQRTARRVNEEFERWLDSREPGRPFFAYLNYFDAHEPYEIPDGFGTRFAAEPTAQDKYDGGVAYIDREIGRLLRNLRERGVLDNTVLVVASDHGEQFGEHGITTHGNSLFTQLLRVPLVVRYPGHVPAGTRVNRAVTLRDLPQTLFALTGVTGAGGERIGGVSLTRLWSDSTAAVSPILAETERTPKWTSVPTSKAPLSAYIDDRYHYIRSSAGAQWLYDWRADPEEEVNLAEQKSNAPLLAEYAARLRSEVRSVREAAHRGRGNGTPAGGK
jgi:arylsulfatase A-like enzyme